MPEGVEDYVRCEGDGFTVFVHREILAGLAVPGTVRFAFGSHGWCRVRLEEAEEAR